MVRIELMAITPNAERLIEDAGRTAYLSFGGGKVGSEKGFIKMLIQRGHLSVLEHASATFRIQGVSRAFTHQMVRDRLCSYTQQSQRYVDESRFSYIEPDSIKNKREAHPLFVDSVARAKQVYAELQELGIPRQDARFVLPNAVESQTVVTADFRQWRHIFELRGGSNAQWEIRKVVIEVLRILKRHAPNTFGDFVIDERTDMVCR